jgi:hypothetical protein
MECINPELLTMFAHMCLGIAIYVVGTFAWEVHKDKS